MNEEVNDNIDGDVSNGPASLRSAFITWVVKKYQGLDILDILSSLDQASETLIRRGLLCVPLWEIASTAVFQPVYNNVIDGLLFKLIDSTTYIALLKYGKLYLAFIKQKPYAQARLAANEPSERTAETSVTQNADGQEGLMLDRIEQVLAAHFPSGFRLDSPIELKRFRSFAQEDFGKEIVLSNDELKNAIASVCFTFEGKAFIVRADIIDKIRAEVGVTFADGTGVVFYDAFYQKFESWLFTAGVISAQMLKALLRHIFPKYDHKVNYFAPKLYDGSELNNISHELKRVWHDDVLLSYEQLFQRLPYIPVDSIKQVLAQSGDFIWSTKGVYTYTGIIEITEDEKKAIREYVAADYRAKGFSSISDAPLDEIALRYPQLSITAIHNAAYVISLASTYDMRGKIITRKGDNLNALAIIKEYCRTLDHCTLQDLLDYEVELTGESHRWIPMDAGYSVMVRTDEDSFIADRYVHFDVSAIDNALDLFVEGEYLPLKAILTFAAFPNCGHIWNLYLLESYCRRFSKRFRFDVLSPNSKNAGTIIRKSCRLNYDQIMADAVAKADVPLNKTDVLTYLCNTGYLGRRALTRIEALIDQAQAIREGRC